MKKQNTRLTQEDIDRRLQELYPELSIDYSTYQGFHKKARFVDKDFGEWWAVPSKPLSGGRHPKRVLIERKPTLAEISAGLPPHLKIGFTEYGSVEDKVRFVDAEYGEFWTSLRNVLYSRNAHKLGHPKRVREASKRSCEDIEIEIQKTRPYITIDRSTFVGIKKKARFIDAEFGDWWAIVEGVLRRGGKHKRRQDESQKIDLGDLHQRLSDRPYLTLIDATFKRMRDPAQFLDSEFGEFWSTPDNVINKGRGHPRRFQRYPGLETHFADTFSVPRCSDVIEINGRRYKPDFRLTDRIFLNTDGLFWHCEARQSKWQHYLMRENFESQGKRILQFYEDEVRDKGHIIKSMLKSLTNENQKVFARKLQLTTEVPRSFFEENHLMGYAPARVLGLTSNGTVHAALSFVVRKTELHIIRFCSKAGINVIGGFSKILNRVLAENPTVDTVVNFVDLRYGTGNYLLHLGFVRVGSTLGWCWTDGKRRYNRLSCRAGNGHSEKQNSQVKKLYKLYDAGQAKFIKKIVKNEDQKVPMAD